MGKQKSSSKLVPFLWDSLGFFSSATMRALATFLLLASIAIQAGASCFDSLNPIHAAEEALEDDSELRTYVLCPDTVFPIAKAFNQDGSPKNGQHPLVLGRSNIHVICGADGKSENSCVLEGGLLHVKFYDLWETGKAATNTLVQGVTFLDAKNINVLAENSGDISLLDCIFKDNHNVSPIYASDPSLKDGYRRRMLTRRTIEKLYGERERKISETPSVSSMHVTVTDCAFLNNIIWSYDSGSIEGLITLRGATMEISHTTFVSTTIMESITMKLGYLIYNDGGNLTSHSNCFIGNDQRIASIVTDNQVGDVQTTLSFVQRNSTELPPTGCEFLARVTTGALDRLGFQDVAFTCENSDAEVCSASSLKKVNPPCLKSLDDVYHSEANLTDDMSLRTYILCPRTIFKVGTRSGNNGTPDDGSHPIIINRSNMRVLCGADGTSQNDCVITGGDIQLGIIDEFNTGGLPATNSLVRGIIFTGAAQSNIQANFPCHVVVQDCIFRDNVNLASIFMQNPAVVGSRRLSSHSGSPDSRQLDAIDQAPFIVVIDCYFLRNVIGTVKGQSSGVIVNHNATLHVRGSTFIRTEDRSSEQYIAYVIANIEGTLEMTGNCFAMNKVTLAPVLSEAGHMEASMNSGNGEVVFAAGCEFIAAYDRKDDTVVIAGISNRRTEEELDIFCVDFDTDGSCYVDVETWLPAPGKGDWEVRLPFDQATLTESASVTMQYAFTGLLSSIVSLVLF